MKRRIQVIFFIRLGMLLAVCLLFSCSKNPVSVSNTETADSSLQEQLEAVKIRSDIEKMINGEKNSKSDTVAIKTDDADILAATAEMLSDSGISKIGSNSQDPSGKHAGLH